MSGPAPRARTRRWRIAAFATFVLITGVYGAATLLSVLLGDPLGPAVLAGLTLYTFPLVGALIALRRPRNRIAWLCLAIGFAWGFGDALVLAVRYEVVRPGSVPRPDVMFPIGNAFWVPGVGLMGTFLLLLFPDGRLPSPRWRPLAWLSGITIVALYAVFLFSPVEPFGVEQFPGVENPFEITQIASLDLIVAPVYFACIVASVVALLIRYRRARGVERIQLRWLLAAGTAAIVGLVGVNVVLGLGLASPGPTDLVDVIFALLYASIPVAVGVAVLRYRLYEIDRLISRTVSYAVIVAVLAAVYLSGVFLLRSLLPLEGDLAVAASTLAVAALFNPLRRRVQHLVDRRFNRPRYDAEIEVQRFAGRLRTHLDIDDLSDDLSGVITRTMHPETTALWLRGERR